MWAVHSQEPQLHSGGTLEMGQVWKLRAGLLVKTTTIHLLVSTPVAGGHMEADEEVLGGWPSGHPSLSCDL